MTKIGVTCHDAFPVAIDVVRELLGDRAEVVPVEVPGWVLDVSEEQNFIRALESMTCILQRPGSFTRTVLSALPNLRHIAVHGAGFDKIDLPAASELGIQVTNAPGANAASVGELVICLITMMLRNMLTAANGVATGQWEDVRLTGSELMGKRLGILGVGHVGSQVVTRALAFGMEVTAYDPAFTESELAARGITPLESDAVIASADILTLHVPLDQQTRHLINSRTIALMKPGAYLLNLSRGPIVDEHALAAALRSGQIKAAALDVREQEPPPLDDPIRNLPNVILTPHIGGSTDAALRRIAAMCAEEMIRVLNDDPVRWPVNQPSTERHPSR
jgi:D-3-phosphoglycerate dehydrogenase